MYAELVEVQFIQPNGVHGCLQADTRAERYGEQIHYDKK